ncbi:MAG: S41 family peptidase [Anaeromyxobacteraceae bacterium]
MPTSLVLALALAASLRSPADRVAIAEGLRDAIRARYVFLSVKPPVDLDGCVAAEAAIKDEEDPLRFYDRMRRCTAAFQDGHLILSVPDRLPPVALGVAFRRTGDGAVRLAGRSPGLVRWLEAEGSVPDADAVLAAGAEVVRIDGRPAAEALEALVPYVQGSSPGARLERAADALGRRDFAYPGARAATLVVAHQGGLRTVTLPWWIAPGAREHAVAGAYARRMELRTADFLDWSGTPAWANADPGLGAARGEPAVPPADAAVLRPFRTASGRVAARLGEATSADGRRYCYAQILTFHTETLDGGAGPRPLPEVLRDHLAGCAARGEDLVLDSRQNEGGYLSHATAVARLLLPAGRPLPAAALVVRATERNEAVYKVRAPAPALGTVRALVTGGRTEAEEVLDAVRDARASGAEFTPAFLERTAGEGVFAGRVVALASPACMSACDRLLATLKAAGRATIVGGPTEGAGGSQQEAGDLSARWTDPSSRLTLSIPNAAMGVAPAGAGRTEGADRFFRTSALENRPVEPDVPYATGEEDLARANQGWRAAAEAALAPPRLARAPQG